MFSTFFQTSFLASHVLKIGCVPLHAPAARSRITLPLHAPVPRTRSRSPDTLALHARRPRTRSKNGKENEAEHGTEFVTLCKGWQLCWAGLGELGWGWQAGWSWARLGELSWGWQAGLGGLGWLGWAGPGRAGLGRAAGPAGGRLEAGWRHAGGRKY